MLDLVIMDTKGKAILVFLILVLVAVITVIRALPPSSLPVNTPASEFSAERAIQHIQVIAREPHPTGSAANKVVRDYIIEKLRELGLETEVQQIGVLENVLGRIKGSNSTEAVLLTAHYDSAEESPGASDDGSGVSVLLETARALGSESLRNTIIFLFTDAEEEGTVGARAFISSHPWATDVRVVIGFDAGGLKGPGVLSATSANNGWLIQQLAWADHNFIGSSAISALAESGTDFGGAFKPAGYSGYAFDLYWDRRIHSPDDNIENINLNSVQHQGYHALSLARHLGNLSGIADPKESDAVFFSVLRLFTIHYSSAWAWPLAILVTGNFIGMLMFGLNRRFLTWRGMIYGILVFIIGLVVAALPGFILEKLIPPWSPAFTGLNQLLLIGTVVLVALVLIFLWYFLARKTRPTSLPDIASGALIPLVAGSLFFSIALPALSFLITWPLLFSLLASANWYFWYVIRKNSSAALAGFIASGVLGIIITVPTIMLGLFDQLLLPLVLLGVLCGFFIPLVYPPLPPNEPAK